MSTVTQLDLLRHTFQTGRPHRAIPQKAKRGFRERWSDGLAALAIVGLSLAVAFEIFRLFIWG